MFVRTLAGLTLASIAATAPAVAGDTIKIGFVTTLTTPAGVLGRDMQTAANIALKHVNGMMGGKKVEILFEDDGFKPEIGKQKSDKLVKQDKVDFMSGFIWSHVLLASRKSILKSGTFLIGANAGPSKMAGKLCHENFFSTSWQNDQTPMAMGEVLNQAKVKSLYVMAPNYAAGKDMVNGMSRVFKGKIVGKDFTKWGKDAQLDFSAELAKAKASGAEGLFVFYPGKAGSAFIKQYEQAGLVGKLPLYTIFTVDAISLPRFQKGKLKGVIGSLMTQHWSSDFDNPTSKKFVADFNKEMGRNPSFYASQSYDAIRLIASAVDAVKGDLTDKDAVRAALMKADFKSVRGKFRFGNNHFPIQDFILRQVVVGKDGNWDMKTIKTVLTDHQDPYAAKCKM